MENVIIYGIIVVAVVFNIIRNFQKEQQKNKDRALNQPRPTTIPNRPAAAPAPFSRPRANETSTTQETYNDSSDKTESTYTPEPAPVARTEYQRIVVPPTESQYSFTASEEGVCSVEHNEIDEDSIENYRYTENDIQKESYDLQLESQDDLKRALLHSIILERKY